MTKKAQKITPNTVLKVAIVESGQKQRVIADRARIHEVRLSNIVSGHREPTQQERARLARVLRRSQSDLFPAPASEIAPVVGSPVEALS